MRQHDNQFVGILLAAGRGVRFDPTGRQNKLLQPLSSGGTVLHLTAKMLRSALPTVVAVVRPGADPVASELYSAGCDVVECPDADEGMAASLVRGLSHAQSARGWLIALGDMPFVQRSTITSLVDALGQGADIAIPVYRGARGNPVAFSNRHLPSLLRLTGDQGARHLLKTEPVTEVEVDDPGIHQDIDVAADLEIRL